MIIFNKGQRTIRYSKDAVIEPNGQAEVSEEQAKVLQKLFPAEIVGADGSVKAPVEAPKKVTAGEVKMENPEPKEAPVEEPVTEEEAGKKPKLTLGKKKL